MTELGALLFLLAISQSSTHPSSNDSKKESFNEVVKGLGTNIGVDQTEGIETVLYTVLNTTIDFEKRLYPSMTMACSEMTYNVTEEDGGGESDNVNGGSMSKMMKLYGKMTSKLWKKKPSR